MKRIFALIMSIALLCAFVMPGSAQGILAQSRIESVEYKGFGIVEVDFAADCGWAEALMIWSDGQGNALEYEVLGGDQDECFLRFEGLEEQAAYEIRLFEGGREQRVSFEAVTGQEYQVSALGDVLVVPNAEPCEWCGSLAHDEDYCPQYWQGVRFVWTWQPDQPAESVGNTQAPSGGSSTRTPQSPAPTKRPVRCDECGEYGHDDDYCPYERCDECGKLGHDDDRCPKKRCDECGEYGHDDDHCPNERCDECGKRGHDDDHCPNERCDECGEYGHDDDRCPNRSRSRHGRYDDDDDDDDDDD